jgi:hypothetical protein
MGIGYDMFNNSPKPTKTIAAALPLGVQVGDPSSMGVQWGMMFLGTFLNFIFKNR